MKFFLLPLLFSMIIAGCGDNGTRSTQNGVDTPSAYVPPRPETADESQRPPSPPSVL